MPTNYRGISLLNCAGKVLALILLNRLHNEVLESIILREQCGFGSRRSTVDLIFSVRQIQEKSRERYQSLYALFVDISKVVDKLNR